MLDWIEMFGRESSFKGKRGTGFYLWGTILFLIGLIILLVPQILVMFIASIFFVTGFGFLYLGWKLNSRRKKWETIEINFHN